MPSVLLCCLRLPESRFKGKHSLDSDEEDEVKEAEKKGLGDEDLSAQEASTIVSYVVHANHFNFTMVIRAVHVHCT